MYFWGAKFKAQSISPLEGRSHWNCRYYKYRLEIQGQALKLTIWTDLWAVFAHILAKRAERKRLSNSRTWASCVGDEETPILEWREQPPSLVWFSLFLVEFLLIERETVSHLIGKHPLYLRQGWSWVQKLWAATCGPVSQSALSCYGSKRNTAPAGTTHPFLVRGQREGMSRSSWGLCPGSLSLRGVTHVLWWWKFALSDQRLHRNKDNPGCKHSRSFPHFHIQKVQMIFESLQDCSQLLLFPVKGSSNVSHRESLFPVHLVCAEDFFQPTEGISTCRMWLWIDLEGQIHYYCYTV